jgi:hypothetical protein
MWKGDENATKDVILRTRVEAENILLRMNELLDIYGSASVADLYDLVGIVLITRMLNLAGVNIRDAAVMPVYGGYRLKIQRVHTVDFGVLCQSPRFSRSFFQRSLRGSVSGRYPVVPLLEISVRGSVFPPRFYLRAGYAARLKFICDERVASHQYKSSPAY